MKAAKWAVYSGTNIFFSFIYLQLVWIKSVHQMEDSILEILDLKGWNTEKCLILSTAEETIYSFHKEKCTFYLTTSF